MWAQEISYTGKTVPEIRNDFQAKLRNYAPLKLIILRREHKLFDTGTVKDKQRMESPQQTRTG